MLRTAMRGFKENSHSSQSLVELEINGLKNVAMEMAWLFS